MEVKKANASQAIPHFRGVIKRFPHTDYADLSYVQLGLCYEYLEQWEEAEKAYEALIQKYTDEKGKPISPYSENVRQALQFAKDRMHKLRMYRLPLIAQASWGFLHIPRKYTFQELSNQTVYHSETNNGISVGLI